MSHASMAEVVGPVVETGAGVERGGRASWPRTACGTSS